MLSLGDWRALIGCSTRMSPFGSTIVGIRLKPLFISATLSAALLRCLYRYNYTDIFTFQEILASLQSAHQLAP